MTHATVASLNVYPIKSCRGIPLANARLVSTGLSGDREWLVVTEAGRFLTQRELPRLALVEIAIGEQGLHLMAPGMPQLIVPSQALGPGLQVTIWNDRCSARDAGAEPAEWFSRFVGRPVRLVQFDSSVPRRSSLQWTRDVEAFVTFTDAFPILVISQASLSDLNNRLDIPLPMDRFRPNVVLEGLQAYDEDRIHELVDGDVRLRIVKPCTRCKITTTDQSTGEVASVEPLKTLKSFRWSKELQGVLFGQNAILMEGLGREMRVGQRLEVIWK
jgi:uncharacterized protein YcbX